MQDKTSKVVFVTGSASGIGLAIATEFARKGATVVVSDLDQDKVQAVTGQLADQGYKVKGIICDVTNEDQIVSAFNETVDDFGRIDVFVNNAGLQYISPVETFPTDMFELLIKVMLVAPFMTIKHVLPIMKRQRWGRIINMSSINGLIGFAGKAAYNSAKHGVIGLTKVVALESAEYGITVNALCPGYVDTDLVRNQLADLARVRNVSMQKVLEEVIYPLVPQKRLLSVQEVAHYVFFLSGEDAGGITGQAIVIDGGYTAQ